MIRKTLYIATLLSGGILCGVGLLLYWLIAVNPGVSISPKYLESILAIESPVYYADGISKIGVFFENSHRQYIPFQHIPNNFVQSIVAAEDHKFFQHYGIDIIGVSRAMLQNLKAGRIVQGGSTITQQTAKNLYKRKDRSLQEKFKELIYALRLEYHYSKEKILEFYVNQFYVSGNGRGLGVAANYYFNKPAKDLNLVECAFIAGSVKRPNYYNPFLKKNEAAALEARERAKKRTGYVLRRMYELGMISQRQYEENSKKGVPFRQGQMSYALNTIMDTVKEALAEPEVETALVDHGIENVATSGIRIYTTIEKDIQKESFYALRKELSRIAVRLEGYESIKLQPQYAKLAKTRRGLEPGSFLFGRISSVSRGGNPSLTVAFKEAHNGSSEEVTGEVNKDNLALFLDSLVKHKRQRWSVAQSGDMDSFLATLSIGDYVYVSVERFDPEENRFVLQLEKYPEVQGGVVVLKDGTIRAMVGGVENRFFNRVMARRLMGSTAKPLLYTAAIQLGWNALDLLNNERDAFVYQGQTYFPRPDHHSPFGGVSINWAGVKSENVASVWLLYNLCERLSEGQFRQLTEGVGLGRGKRETYLHYTERIRDKYGILVNDEQLYGLAFTKAVEELGPDLLFAGKSQEHELLRRFHYKLAADSVDKDDSSSEADIRRQILKRSYVHIAQLGNAFKLFRRGLNWQNDSSLRQDSYRLYYDNQTNTYSFGEQPPEGLWLIVDSGSLAKMVQGGQFNGKEFEWGEVLLDGLISFSTLEILQNSVEKIYQNLSHRQAYGPEILYGLKDFRVLVGLRYLVSLCQEMGIESPMETVLSFPLGSNVVSLLDIARAYETIGTGWRKTSGRFDAGDGPAIIDRIESRRGDVVYRPLRSEKKVVDKETSLAVTDILKNVVAYGTGRFARDYVRLETTVQEDEQGAVSLSLPVPLFGKTGTANSFRNAAFAGFVPGPTADKRAVQVENGYFLASYVGYDDNKPLVRNTTRMTGSAGALPTWSMVANAIVDRVKYPSYVDLQDLVFANNKELPLIYPKLGQSDFPADGKNKINVDESWKMSYLHKGGGVRYGNGMIAFGETGLDGTFVPSRHFKPYWTLAN